MHAPAPQRPAIGGLHHARAPPRASDGLPPIKFEHGALGPRHCAPPHHLERSTRERVSGLTEERFLGQGSFGRVVLIEDKRTRDTYALKIIAKRRRTGGDEKLLESLRTEITILRIWTPREHFTAATRVRPLAHVGTVGRGTSYRWRPTRMGDPCPF